MSDAPSTRNGLWIFPSGSSIFVDEDKGEMSDDRPLDVLQRFFQYWECFKANGEFSEDNPFDGDAVQAWMRENRFTGEGKQASREYWTSVARVAIEHGLTLVWAGAITTSIRELDKLKSLIRSSADFAQLNWPRDLSLNICCIHKTEDADYHQMTVAELLPPPVLPLHALLAQPSRPRAGNPDACPPGHVPCSRNGESGII